MAIDINSEQSSVVIIFLFSQRRFSISEIRKLQKSSTGKPAGYFHVCMASSQEFLLLQESGNRVWFAEPLFFQMCQEVPTGCSWYIPCTRHCAGCQQDARNNRKRFFLLKPCQSSDYTGHKPFPKIDTEFLINITQSASGPEILGVLSCRDKVFVWTHTPFLIIGNKDVDIIT